MTGLEAVPRRDARAWLAALALYVAGDVATTAAGLHLGAVESNPAALAVVDAVGLWLGFALLKAPVVALVGVLWAISPREWRAVAPATLAGVGAVVVVLNSRVLALTGGMV